jgi:hypothetical protein
MKQLVVVASTLLIAGVVSGQDAVEDSSWLTDDDPIEERLPDSLISVYYDTAQFLGFDFSLPDVISCGFAKGEDTVFYDCDDKNINCFLAVNVYTDVVLEIYEWRMYFDWLGVNTISRRIYQAQHGDVSSWDMRSLDNPVTPEDLAEVAFCDSVIATLDVFSLW